MKTQSVHQQPPLCEIKLKQSFSWSQLRSVFQPLLHLLQMVHAHLDTQDGLVARLRVALSEILASNRYTAGVVLLLIVAPLSSIFYLACDSALSDDSWYYLNNYWFFYTLSPYLMLFFASAGIFLLFPVKCKTSYMATVWPIGYSISKLLYLGYFVNSNEAFQQTAPWFLILIGVFAAIGFLLASDYLLYRKFHLKHGTIARIKGIIQTPGIPAADKMRMIEHESLELENFHQRY